MPPLLGLNLWSSSVNSLRFHWFTLLPIILKEMDWRNLPIKVWSSSLRNYWKTIKGPGIQSSNLLYGLTGWQQRSPWASHVSNLFMEQKLFSLLNSLYPWKNSSRTLKESLTIWSEGFIRWWKFSRSGNRSWTWSTIISRRSSKPLTGRAERKISSWVI